LSHLNLGLCPGQSSLEAYPPLQPRASMRAQTSAIGALRGTLPSVRPHSPLRLADFLRDWVVQRNVGSLLSIYMSISVSVIILNLEATIELELDVSKKFLVNH